MTAKKIKLSGTIIAIDGPAGAGKSTVSRLLAESINGKLLDTGAMYRAVAYFGNRSQAKTENEYAVIARLLKFSSDKESGALLVNGEDLGARIRTRRVSETASKISKYGKI